MLPATRPLASLGRLPAAIAAEGQQEPIDGLKVEGRLWGFNGCHRVAAHERPGMTTIQAGVCRATPSVLRLHLF